ncbi:MAG: hypothetical protein ACTHOU_15370 [Aureliella sp.]
MHLRWSIVLAIALAVATDSQAADFVWTIGGGYSPEGNQASLEANVLFFRGVIADTHRQRVRHQIHFADGYDPEADVQVLKKQPENDASPALALLKDLFGPPGATGGRIEYRNHEIPEIDGSNRLRDLRQGFNTLKNEIKSGDRLIVYVTAHGGAARGDQPYDTSITCWGNRDLSMSEFSRWLDTLPESVPVVLVMAQCYCGGFAHTLFANGDCEEGLSANVRTGFYAQRHDLPAAGCRPDVENDEEYSSYFWGALVGHSRSGKPAVGADCDGDGVVSLAEAHAYAVVASETIDIPLCGSDALLRWFSRIPDYEIDHADAGRRDGDEDSERTPANDAGLQSMSGTLRELADRASPTARQMITGLADRLKLSLGEDVGQTFRDYDQARRDYRAARRSGGPGRRGRGSFGRRRDAREAILEKWPELADPTTWNESEMLAGQAGRTWVEQVEALPSYQEYVRSRDQRDASRRAIFEAEMRQVRFQRLIHTLESVVLAENLPQVASADIVARYRAMRELEQSPFR